MEIRAPRKVRFECQRCARCCGDTPHRGRIIYLLEEEVRRISKLTKLHPMEFASPISGIGNYKHRMKKRNGICVFLSNKACKIYKVRPSVCQLYPFTMRISNNTLVFEVSEDCPGIGLGNQVLDKDFRKMSEFARVKFEN
jgi:hypothetical protein